jgi:hypothetical protein
MTTLQYYVFDGLKLLLIFITIFLASQTFTHKPIYNMKKILLFLIVIIVFGCVENASVNNIEVNAWQNQFSKEAWVKVIPYEFDVNWTQFHLGYSDDLQSSYVEFPIFWKDNFNPSLLTRNQNEKTSYRLLMLQKENQNTFLVLKFIGDSKDELSLNETKNFSGQLFILDSNKRYVLAKKLVDGLETIRYSSSGKVMPLCHTETVFMYKDWYQSISGGSWDYLDSEYIGTWSYTICEDGTGGAGPTSLGGGTYSGYGGGSPYTPCPNGVDCLYDTESDVIDFSYTCPENFTFKQATLNKLWQEAGLTNVYINLIYMDNLGRRTTTFVKLDQVYFGLPYFNVEGDLVFNQATAANISADVFNEAEYDTRAYFKSNPNLASFTYANYFLDQMKYHMREKSFGTGRVDLYGSTNNHVDVVMNKYIPCM